jgi:hypothetical protein
LIQIPIGLQQTKKIESEERLASEYQTSDTSIGRPPGTTRERFISFARNTVNRGISQKHYSPRKGQNKYIYDPQLFK